MSPDDAPPFLGAGGSAGDVTRRRILSATIDCVAREGVAEASMAAIAAAAGVSKALLHYHYSNRARLLAEAVTQLAQRLVARESASMEGADGSKAVDALWQWLESELARGELRVLLELSLVREPTVRAAAAAAARRRRLAAAGTVAQLFARLALTPKVPASLLGDASVAFIDGLALDSMDATGEPRVSFDVFWLALLSLAE